jgi:hypothetical protein
MSNLAFLDVAIGWWAVYPPNYLRKLLFLIHQIPPMHQKAPLDAPLNKWLSPAVSGHQNLSMLSTMTTTATPATDLGCRNCTNGFSRLDLPIARVFIRCCRCRNGLLRLVRR